MKHLFGPFYWVKPFPLIGIQVSSWKKAIAYNAIALIVVATIVLYILKII